MVFFLKFYKNQISKKEAQDLFDYFVRQIELSIGQAMAAEYNAIIIDGMEDVLAAAVDQAVAEAVNEGISAAAAEAGIRAWLDVLARGGSEQDAWDAGCDAAGLERGC